MRIVCDDKIPYIRKALEQIGEVTYLPGSDITPADVRTADALIVRTRTHCDRQLLADSNVQLVVTATIGYDHLDTDWLDKAGIKWTNCPGCNATSVAQWVREALRAVTPLHSLQDKTLAIVGYGHVGRAVAAALCPLVRQILICDPPLFEKSKSLESLAPLADIITFHTPLTHSSPHPTYHLADDRFFSLLRPGATVINAARGGVIDEEALLRAMDSGQVASALIDTWEGEPRINSELLRRAHIATPHIAGYSADGKANASRMAVEALAKHFNLPIDGLEYDPVPPAEAPWDITRDSRNLKEQPDRFEWFRGHYPVRREFAQIR